MVGTYPEALRALLPPGETREVLTYSADSDFRNCQKLYQLRHLKLLEAREEKPEPMAFGSAIHKEIQNYYEGIPVPPACPVKPELYRAMVRAYFAQMPPLPLVKTEHIGWGEIRNPATGACSKSFILAYKVDGVVQNDEGHWLYEVKTTSKIDGDYLEKLWTDFQTTLYLYYLEQEYSKPFKGVIYDILPKAQLRLKQNETPEQFEARLDAWYATEKPFRREALFVSPARITQLREELWIHTQAILEARRRGQWFQNPSYCFHWNRRCEFYRLCRSGESDLVKREFYQSRESHPELSVELPIF